MKSRLFLQCLWLAAAISSLGADESNYLVDANGGELDDTTIITSTSGTSPNTSPPGDTSTSITETTAVSGTTETPGTATSLNTTTTYTDTTVPTTTVTQTPSTIAMDSITLPNSVNPPNAKVIYQRAVGLTNQIQALTEQIVLLQNETNPNNSVLILQLEDMQNNATEMNNTLVSLVSQLNTANANLIAAQDNYNNVSRVFTCIASYYGYPTTMGPTTTVTTAATTPTTPPKWTCDKNLTANSTQQTVTFDRIGNGTSCGYTVSALANSGTVNYNLSLTVSGNGSVSVIDVISASTLATYGTSGNYTNTTSTTVVRFLANNAELVSYNLTYSAFDPCLDYGCNTTCSVCRLNSLGQPFCQLSNTVSACYSIAGDGKSCQKIDPCKVRGKPKCSTSDLPYCLVNDSDCTATCVETTEAPPLFEFEEGEASGVRGLLHRWVF